LNGKTIRLATRTVHGQTETLYIHKGPVSTANTRYVLTGRLGHFGQALVNAHGYPYYAFVPVAKSALCSSSCNAAWPPVRLTIEMTIDASPALDEMLVSTKLDPERHRLGDRVVLFSGRVLHTRRGDRPLQPAGQAKASFGGRWYLIAPTGALIRRR